MQVVAKASPRLQDSVIVDRNATTQSLMSQERASHSSAVATARSSSVLQHMGLLAVAAALFAAVVTMHPVEARAADTLKTCACLLQNCRGELLRCLGDVKCAANIACLQACNGRADETECQIACGDLFQNEVVDRFNTCAVSEQKCVPQKVDQDLYPVPPREALVAEFPVERLRGPWYISAGQNPTFDTFDCQLHTFEPTAPRSFEVALKWRVRTPDGGFFTRSAMQKFVQDEVQPALLLNHGNELLNYDDDWYVLSYKLDDTPDDYFLVYYRGVNDAWDGYGGAVLYTRSRTVPPSIVGEVERASAAAGLNFDSFIRTDNSCGPQQPLVARLEKKVEELESAVVGEVVAIENKVAEAGKEELRLLQQLGKGLAEVERDGELFLSRLGKDERQILEQMEAMEMGKAGDLEDLFSNPIPLRKLR